MSVKDTHGIAFQPVDGWLPVPPRRPLTTPGRRPTVAILDTGVAQHDWFADRAGLDDVIIRAGGHDGDLHRHGTFVAGIVRQYAPDARIISIELAQDGDGLVRNGAIHDALASLRDAGIDGVPFVDVVCLAVGYRKTGDGKDDPHHTDEIQEICRALGERGVLLVASAGNKPPSADDNSESAGPVYPAFLAQELAKEHATLPIVAVGATDPNGTPADYSVRGDWVTRQWVGTGVISTFPILPGQPILDVDFQVDEVVGSTIGDKQVPFPSGFARGSGTSFAAAGFAGRVAQAMLDEVGPSGLADLDPGAARARARQALDAAGHLVSPRSD